MPLHHEAGGSLAWWACHSQLDRALSALAGFGGAIAALGIVELLARSRALPLRLAGVALFAVPAALAAYFATRGLAGVMLDGGLGTQWLSLALAVPVGGAAAMRCLAPGESSMTGTAVPSSHG